MTYNGVKLPEFPENVRDSTKRVPYAAIGENGEVFWYNDLVLPKLPHERGAV